jgi:hypothetical protein
MQSLPTEAAANILYAVTRWNRSPAVLIYWGDIHYTQGVMQYFLVKAAASILYTLKECNKS